MLLNLWKENKSEIKSSAPHSDIAPRDHRRPLISHNVSIRRYSTVHGYIISLNLLPGNSKAQALSRWPIIADQLNGRRKWMLCQTIEQSP